MANNNLRKKRETSTQKLAKKLKSTVREFFLSLVAAGIFIVRGSRWLISTAIGHPRSSIFILFLAVVFGYLLTTRSVFVDDAEIAADITSAPFSGATLTRGGIAAMSSVANRRLAALPRFSANALEIVERPSPNFETSRQCKLLVNFSRSGNELLFEGISRVTMSSAAEVTSSAGISITKTAHLIRSALHRLIPGWPPPRVIVPRLHRTETGFAITVHSSPVVTPRTAAFTDINQAFDVLARILIDFAAPELSAYEYVHRKDRQPGTISEVAKRFLDDQRNAAFIEAILLEADLEHSMEHSSRGTAFAAHRDVLLRILRETDFSMFGQEAAVVRLLYAARAATAEISYLTTSVPYTEKLRDEVYSRIVEPHTGVGSAVGRQLLLAWVEMNFGKQRQALAKVRGLLRDWSIRDEESVSAADLVLPFVDVLLKESRVEDANGLISFAETATKRFGFNPQKLVQLAALRAVTDVYLGNNKEFLRLASLGFGDWPCLELMAIQMVQPSSARSGAKIGTKTDMAKALLDGYARLEKAGIRSFDFYNGWGSLQSAEGLHRQAIEKYLRALKFDGVQTWAYLNAGKAAEEMNDIPAARNYYQKSLSLGTIPQAVVNYLSMTSRLRLHKEYLEVYGRYYPVLFSFDHERRSGFYYFALLASCMLRQGQPPSILGVTEDLLVDGNIIKTQSFDRTSCTFR